MQLHSFLSIFKPPYRHEVTGVQLHLYRQLYWKRLSLQWIRWISLREALKVVPWVKSCLFRNIKLNIQLQLKSCQTKWSVKMYVKRILDEIEQQEGTCTKICLNSRILKNLYLKLKTVWISKTCCTSVLADNCTGSQKLCEKWRKLPRHVNLTYHY